MHLPIEKNLPIDKIAKSFANTSATYKYFWFLSLIELIENEIYVIEKRRIFALMISKAWYSINYYKLSFGSQDNIQSAIEALKNIELFDEKLTSSEISERLYQSNNKQTFKILNHFDSNVPHWFLSPWFVGKNKRAIYEASAHFENNCIYALDSKVITVNPTWFEYFRQNAKILKEFTLWNLTRFLQVRNPHIPDITGKLIQPTKRKELTKQRNIYWKPILTHVDSIHCIFTGKPIELSNYALDHFIPHAFVSHDLIWNLLPIDPTFNSKKNNKLPILEKHFDAFFKVQKIGFDFHRKQEKTNPYLEEYWTIFPNLTKNDSLEYQKFKETIQPLSAIAHNNGFYYLNEHE